MSEHGALQHLLLITLYPRPACLVIFLEVVPESRRDLHVCSAELPALPERASFVRMPGEKQPAGYAMAVAAAAAAEWFQGSAKTGSPFGKGTNLGARACPRFRRRPERLHGAERCIPAGALGVPEVAMRRSDVSRLPAQSARSVVRPAAQPRAGSMHPSSRGLRIRSSSTTPGAYHTQSSSGHAYASIICHATKSCVPADHVTSRIPAYLKENVGAAAKSAAFAAAMACGITLVDSAASILEGKLTYKKAMRNTIMSMAGAAFGGFTIATLFPLLKAILPVAIGPIVVWTATAVMGTGLVVKLLKLVKALLKAIAFHWCARQTADHPTCPQPPRSTGAASAPVSPTAGGAEEEGVEYFEEILGFEEALECGVVSLPPAAVPCILPYDQVSLHS